MLYSVLSLANFNLPAHCQSILVPARRSVEWHCCSTSIRRVPSPQKLTSLTFGLCDPRSQIIGKPMPSAGQNLHKKKRKSREKGVVVEDKQYLV